MAQCEKCAASLADDAAFCPQCGNKQVGIGGAPASHQGGLAQNVSAGLCYLFGWFTGILFLLIDKRPAIRFHAAQSLVVFGDLLLLRIVLGPIFGFGLRGGAWSGFAPWGFAEWLYSLLEIVEPGELLSFEAWGFSGLFFAAMGFLSFLLWLLLMFSAFMGKKLRVPLAAVVADRIAGK